MHTVAVARYNCAPRGPPAEYALLPLSRQYMAPEQLARRGHDHAVDCWALGIVAVEMLTGSLPLGRATAIKQQAP